MRLATIALIVFSGLAAQAQTDIHACQAEPAIQEAYNQNRNSPNPMKVLRDALAANPDDLFLNRWLIRSPEVRPGDLAAEYQRKLVAHPGEPLFLYLYGESLAGKDTNQAIRLVREALAKDPGIAAAYGTLIEIYASPVFLDRSKLLENLRAYTSRCPEDETAYRNLSNVEDDAALKEMTAKYRAAVEAHDEIGSVAQYPQLWALEFRIADPKAFDHVRDQVRADMQKIRKLDPSDKDDSKSLIDGYRLLGDTASADALKANRVPAKTFNTVFNDWMKAHGPRIDYEQMLPASEQWVKDWPNDTNAWYWRMMAVARRKGATAQEIEKAGQDVLDSNAKTFMGWSSNPYPLTVAEVWEEHDIRLKDCLGLLREAEKALTGDVASYDDRRARSTAPESVVSSTRFRMLIVESSIDRKLTDYDAVRIVLERMKAATAAHPDNARYETMAWHDESGALAEAEGHKPDALAHYQLGTQSDQPKARAQALWTEMGGTEEGFASWGKKPEPPKSSPVASNPLPWTAKNQPLTALKTHDLSGKTWTIAELKGKKTLINVWATWCEPCRQELPYVQKLYEQTKERNDIQVITISTDEDPGLLDPFLKAGNYTFPVLLAKTLVDDLTAGVSIPRNWVVDATGVLREEGEGFSATEWPDKILTRLEATTPLH